MTTDPSRRQFLIAGVAATGGLLVGCGPRTAGDRRGHANGVSLAPGSVALNAWVQISPDGLVTVAVHRAEMGQGVSGWSEVSPWLLHSWSTLWVVLVVLGAVNVPLFWYLGGWWYRLRLKWAGATSLDSLRPRLLFVYSSLVYALPVVLVMLGETLLFPNYRLARDAEGNWTLIFVVLSFWSVVVSYCGATRTVTLARRKALIWFLLRPWTLYAVELGLWMWLFESFNAALRETV